MYKITSDDIAALKAADSVSFHYYDGRGYMRAAVIPFWRVRGSAYLRDGGTESGWRVFTAREQRLFPAVSGIGNSRQRDIDVTTSMFGYGEPGETWNLGSAPKATAYEYEGTAQYSKTWSTLVSLFRAGDELQLLWLADNNSETIRLADLHTDQLDINVKRGDKEMRFHVSTRITPDNSARMIKRNGD